MSAFVPALPVSQSQLTPAAPASALSPLRGEALARARGARMSTATYRYSPLVDQFFAKDVRAQYVAKACPSGVAPVQCFEGATASEPFEVRTLKRQSMLRYRQLPTGVKLRNMYETRANALLACHGCSHEEDRVLRNPMLASAMAVGQAEAARACSRYVRSSGAAEDVMCRAVENVYAQAVNGSGEFSTACTDGQAKYEAYLNKVRCGTTAFRVNHYSKAAQAGAAFAARKLAIAKKPLCGYEVSLYSKFPRLAGSIRPAFGYYTPFVTLPSEYMYATGVVAVTDTGRLAASRMLGMLTSSAAKSISITDANAPEQ